MREKNEFCIMPPSPYYATQRFAGSERHEVFEGRTGNRQKSIEDGLVIFLTPEDHRTGKESVHMNAKNPKWIKVKQIAQKRWMEFYNKDIESFRKRYGRNYLDDEDIDNNSSSSDIDFISDDENVEVENEDNK